jgi:hypothetical protein
MKTRPVLPFLTSSLLLFSGGCGFFQGDKTADQTQPPTPDPAAVAPPPVPVDQVKPLPEVDMAALGLIPSVTPNQRRSEIIAGRTNPFALIPVQATLRQSVCQAEKPKEEETLVASGTPINTDSAAATEAVKPTMPGDKSTTPSNGSASTAGTTSVAPPVFVTPPLYPNDARAVVVSGIVKIEQKNFAIVKAPGESVTRHVTVGDRLSGGQVTVKSINANRGNAAVVLEQYDQSVIRPVGQAALPPLTPPPPVAANNGFSGMNRPVDADGMVTVTNPDGTTVRFPAAMAEQQMRNNASARLRTQRPQAQLQRIALKGSEAEGFGYGEIRNLAVLKLDVNQRGSNLEKSTGILCNAGDDTIQVRNLTFQVEDPEENTILDSIQVALGRTYSIQKGQKLAFDGAAPDFRGRSPGDVIVKLIDWTSNNNENSNNSN